MKPFVPSPGTKAFYDQLITIANGSLYQAANAGGVPFMRFNRYTLPPIPPDPVDPVDAAFLHNICLPLYNAIVAAYAADDAAWAQVIGSPANPATQPSIWDLQTAAAAGDSAAQQQLNEYYFQQASSSAP